MSALVKTQECYPLAVSLPGIFEMPAPEPNHERCSGGQTIEGLLGGWLCPCECHQAGSDRRKAQ